MQDKERSKEVSLKETKATRQLHEARDPSLDPGPIKGTLACLAY